MPLKHHASRRHKSPKATYRVTNWSEYNESLRQRGDLTVWFDEELVSKWRAPPLRATRLKRFAGTGNIDHMICQEKFPRI